MVDCWIVSHWLRDSKKHALPLISQNCEWNKEEETSMKSLFYFLMVLSRPCLHLIMLSKTILFPCFDKRTILFILRNHFIWKFIDRFILFLQHKFGLHLKDGNKTEREEEEEGSKQKCINRCKNEPRWATYRTTVRKVQCNISYYMYVLDVGLDVVLDVGYIINGLMSNTTCMW